MTQIFQLNKEDLISAIREVMAEFTTTPNREDNSIPDTEVAMLTREELCERWHISKATLGNYQKAGRIKPTRLGGRRVLYALADIKRVEAKR